MSLLTQGISQVTAAAKAGMSERAARKYAHSGRVPSQAKAPHTWRTRPDPFAEVWPEVEALLRQDGGLQAGPLCLRAVSIHDGLHGEVSCSGSREANLTQQRMAKKLGVKGHSISRLEQRSDMLLSTLRDYIGKMRGELVLTARLPNREPVRFSRSLCSASQRPN